MLSGRWSGKMANGNDADHLRQLPRFHVRYLGCCCHLFGALAHFLDRSLQEEGLLRNVVVLSIDDFAEPSDSVFELYIASLQARELLGYKERLREEALHFARARYNQLVFIRK